MSSTTVWMERNPDGVFEAVEPARDWVARVEARRRLAQQEQSLLESLARFLRALRNLEEAIYADAPFPKGDLADFLRAGAILSRLRLVSGCLHPVLAAGLRRHAWLLQRLPDFPVAVRIAWRSRFMQLPPEELLDLQRMAEQARAHHDA